MRECDGGWRARPGGACAARAGGIRQVAELGSTPPPFGVDDVPGLAAPWFSEPIRVEELGSQQDLNFLICGADGRRGVLKVGSPCFDHAALLLQNAAMAHVADTGLPFGTPCALPSADGRFVVSVERDGAAYDVRVLTYVEGAPLRALSVRPRWARRLLGQTAGAVSRALASFSDPAADRSFQWALDQAPAVVAAFSHDLPAFHRELVGRAMAPYEAVVPQFAGRLRRQVLHGDVTEYNVVVTRSEDGRRCAHGLIDFGDLAEGFLVGEAAVSAAAAARCEPEDALSAMTDVVQAFHEVNALEEAELAALYPLVLARTAVSAVSGARQATVTPRNAYVTDDMGRLWAALELLVEVPGALAEALWRVACGLPARRQRRLDLRSLAARARPVVDLGGRTAFAVDLSAGSDGFRFGGWRTEAGIRGAVEAPEGSVAAGRFGEARLPYGEPGPEEPATLHLGVDLFVHAGTPVRAPLAGKIERVASRSIVLRHEGLDEDAIWVRIAGLTPTVSVGVTLPAGGNLGAVAEAPDRLPSHVHVQLAMDAVGEPPGLVRPSLGAAWLAICPDPSPLLGIDAAAPADTSGQVLAPPPVRRFGAAALLRAAAGDLPWVAALLVRSSRAGVPGHGQQRRRGGPQPSRRR